MRAALIATLSKHLSPIESDFFAESNLHICTDELTPELSEKLRLILSVIHSGHKLRHSNVTASGDVFTDCITSPIKIEYSIKSGMFRLSHYPDVSKRPVKSNLSRMFNLSISNSEVDKQSVSKMMRSRLEAESLIFTVHNSKHRAIERAKILFSEYPREIIDNYSDDGELKGVEFVLYYYSFQETELIRDILSFGPRIKVISPKRIVKQIIEKLNFAE